MSLDRALTLALEHHRAGRLDAAQAIYAKILEVRPDHGTAAHLLGQLHRHAGELDLAARWIGRTVELAPRDARLHAELGDVLRSLGRLAPAAASYRTAIQLEPGLLEAYANLGLTLQAQGQADAAIEIYRQALALKPDTPEILVNLGTALNLLGRLDEAIATLRRTIELLPNAPEVHNNLACALRDQGNFAAAFASFRQALALRPSYARAHSNLITAMDFAPGIDVVEAQAERGRWYRAQRRTGAARYQDWPNAPDPERKLRLGYVSADFRRHSAAFAFGPVLRGHDRDRFAVVCYSGVTLEDAVTARFKADADLWRPMVGLSDEALAQQIRADAIDLLIDLSGHSVGNRLTMFTAKPAPIQVTAWGHSTGTGIPEIDALFADPVMIRSADRPLFAETVIDLPCVLTYEAPPEAPDVAPPPALAARRITFGCLNRFAKVTDAALALWSDILHDLPDSRLLLKDKVFSQGTERANTLARLTRLGIAADRVLLLGTTDHRGHLAAYGAVDIALDPFPQNGGITTLEALWMGVPVVTQLGTTLTGRVGGALLTGLGLSEWIAQDADGYRAIAARVAGDLTALATLRAGLRARILASPVGNTGQYVRAVEAVYRDLWRRWCAGRRHDRAATPP